MVILVTGAAGLLGQSVCRQLASRGEDVVGVVRPSSRARIATWQHLTANLADPGWTTKGFPEQIDAVIHLAQSRRFRDFPDGASDVFGVNVHATARLLDYAVKAGATHFVYASSGGLYRRGDAPLTENAPLEPPGDLGFYLGSKAAAEILSQGYASLLNVVILRPFFIYGPDQGRDMLIPRIFDSVKDGRVVRLDGQNGLSINPVHVEDAAAAVIGATKLGQGAVINVAGPETLSLLEIALSFGEHLGALPTFEQSGQASRSLVGSIDLMTELLHNPQRKLRDSIDDIAGVQ